MTLVEGLIDNALNEVARIMRAAERNQRPAHVAGECGGRHIKPFVMQSVACGRPTDRPVADRDRFSGRHSHNRIGARRVRFTRATDRDALPP